MQKSEHMTHIQDKKIVSATTTSPVGVNGEFYTLERNRSMHLIIGHYNPSKPKHRVTTDPNQK